MDSESGCTSVGDVLALARRQHGVVSRAQLLALGLGPDAVKHRVRRRRLHPVARGVYAVGRSELSRHGVWMAAILACGPTAALSHESAGALWGIVAAESRGGIQLSVSGHIARHRPGLVVRRRTFAPGELAQRHGIPVTSPVCTLVDLATRLSRDELEAAVIEADVRALVDAEQLRIALGGLAGRRGIVALRSTLDRRTFAITDSELERRFLPLARDAGMPMPLTRELVNGYRVDFYWPDLGLVVETDGLRYHRTPAQQAHDRRRDQVHAAAGLTPLRFTHEQVSFQPSEVRETLAAIRRRLGQRYAAR